MTQDGMAGTGELLLLNSFHPIFGFAKLEHNPYALCCKGREINVIKRKYKDFTYY